MPALDPIPTPPQVLVREWCTRYLPIFAFTGAVVATALLWRNVGLGGIPGIAEAEPALVTAPQAGLLSQVLVPPFEPVQAGQPIAVLEPVDPRVSLDLLQTELALARMQLQPTPAEDNALNFERIRVELLRTQSELAVAKVNLARAQNVVARYEPLRREQLISEDIFELALTTRDAHQAEVDAKASAVNLIEQRLADLSPLGIPQDRALSNSPASELIHRLAERQRDAQAQLGPLTLVAPISGLVHAVRRQTGESVVAGEALFVISPFRSDRIVGYLRQPYPVDLQVGMPVEVATRERPRRTADSQVIRIGARVEAITNSLAIVPPNALLDAGLPFVVALPPGLDLRPGEIVDLRLRAHRQPQTPPSPTEDPSGAEPNAQVPSARDLALRRRIAPRPIRRGSARASTCTPLRRP